MFSRDCAEFIKALGSFDYACANKHLMRISKSYPTVGSICSRVSQCESVYSSMQYLKPKLFRREDHLYHLYNEIASDLEREILAYRDISIAMGRGSFSESDSIVGATGQRQQGSGHTSPTLTMTEAGAPSLRTPKDIRAVDHPVNLSPTFSLHQQQSTGAGRAEAQSVAAADHIVLYTILHELCNLRMITIGVYRMMSQSTTEIEMETILPEVEHALHMYDGRCQEVQNTVLGSGIQFELKILRHGLLLDRAIAEYDVQISSTHLYLARISLTEWKQQTLEQDYTEKSHYRPEETSWRYSLFSSSEEKNKSVVKGKSNLLSNHYLWLNRWITSERSKLTIYFMDILLEKERAMGGDERSLWTDMDPDMHGLIRTFRKKAGARSISFVYEISPDVRFSTTGFISANAPYETATGLNSFPCIYSYPPDPPKDHWPNIISIMQGSVSLLRQFRSQYFYDRKIGCTYYVARIDRHVSIVIIYLDKHPTPDGSAMEFLQLLAGKLRHTDVLTALRTE
ncbi:hypothetical protein CPB97_004712 [Podila verticillata]|nr:hypothetical protein CPB97_004712 [Podila verticillata]